MTKKKETKKDVKKVENSENTEVSNETDLKQVKVPIQVALESAFGAASFLASKTESHKFLFAQDFDWLIMPPVSLKQFQIIRRQKDNAPLAFISWASLNDEVEKRILSGNRKLAPADWKSGEKVYLIDIISPFLSQKQVLEQLSESIFKDKKLFITKANPDSKTLETIELKDLLKLEAEKEANKKEDKKSTVQ